jgi:drug/metabolite transporter (DMT)-like permease
MMVVASLRTRHPTARIMFVGSLACAAALLPPALLSGERVVPETGAGWGVVVALAIVCHAAGQGLIAFSLARLPAAFSSLALLIEPVVAAGLAWALFAEAMSGGEVAGALAILGGIAIARRGTAGEGAGRAAWHGADRDGAASRPARRRRRA